MAFRVTPYIHFTYTHKKSGSLLTVFRFFTYKKAGLHCCCSAFRGPGIAFNSEQATPKPTPICTYMHTPQTSVYNKDIHIPRTSKCCNVLELFRIFQVPKCQEHSAIDAFIMSCNYPPERHNPKAWANYECKGNENFANVQIFLKKVYGFKFIVKEFTRKGYVKPPKKRHEHFQGPRGLIDKEAFSRMRMRCMI